MAKKEVKKEVAKEETPVAKKEPVVEAAKEAVEAKEDIEIHYHAGNPMKVIRNDKGELESLEPL